MNKSRLEIALQAGAFEWPTGSILAFRPDPQHSALPPDRTHIVHGFRSAYEDWQTRGFKVTPEVPDGSFAAAYVVVPRAKELARQFLGQAVQAVEVGGLIVVDGAKTDGIDSIAKLLRSTFDQVGTLSKGHGKILWFERPEKPPEIVSNWVTFHHAPEGWVTAPGVFSATKIDQGSELLARHLPPLSGRGADLGAGWGYLSAQVLESMPEVVHLDLVEAEWTALKCAEQNVSDTRAAFHWADALTFNADAYDFVVSNPPFHTTRKAEPALGQGFVTAAARLLKRNGTLALVANRHLPYEAVLSKSFLQVQTLVDTHGFKVIQAQNPRPKAGH